MHDWFCCTNVNECDIVVRTDQRNRENTDDIMMEETQLLAENKEEKRTKTQILIGNGECFRLRDFDGVIYCLCYTFE